MLAAVNITKHFGTFTANDGIDLELFPAEIHALLGESGAGKSTLVRMIKTVLAGPAAARTLGIAIVFQHFSLFENLTVADNVAVGLDTSEPLAAVAKRLSALSRDCGLPLAPDREVSQLSVGERQCIEIVRALMQKPKLLIEGCAVLYISHKLDEVKPWQRSRPEGRQHGAGRHQRAQVCLTA